MIYNYFPEEKYLKLIFSVIAGIAIAIFSVVFVKLFEKGGNMSFVIPLVYGGSIVLTSIVSHVWLSEKISLWNLVGLVVISFGFLIIVTSKAITPTK